MNYTNIEEIFGEDVFDRAVMEERLPKRVLSSLQKTIDEGTPLDSETADEIAQEMKNWAIEKGATHYTHWFQPLNGNTAEKHDSFISLDKKGGVIMKLSGKQLIKGEPDASSFPSGGLRATFEARGYTIWDCTSPAFVRHDDGGATLCIPTAFCSYTGEALDVKTPLLRSMDALNEQALRVVRLFGNTTAKKVFPVVGLEQEYFIIDRAKYLKREDLIFTGRTLFGARPPKGQELDDHYFGTLRPRIAAYMHDVDEALWRLGVPAKTEHNEVAPSQHELAVLHEKANVAVDHNQVVMQTLKRIATYHGLRCLLHEKPFEGVNGSGKHDNWSLSTDEGVNLMDPGKTPHDNIQFLFILVCVLRAVDRHADLLREAAADIGNDLRLGGDEAPPSVISVFVGEQLEDVIEQLTSTGYAEHSKRREILHTGVSSLAELKKDATDRNRTSPFAFTGNKFEFRMLGSRDSAAETNMILNTIIAESFRDACDRLENAEDFESALHALIREYATAHRRIIWDGNGYGDEWAKEAEKRGLRNIRSMVEAIPALETEKAEELFGSLGVLSAAELRSRAEIKYEIYAKDILIEARTMLRMAGKQLIPAMTAYAQKLADGYLSVSRAAGEENAGYLADRLSRMNRFCEEAGLAEKNLSELEEKAAGMPDGREKAVFCREMVVPAMNALRGPIDGAELIVDKREWPVPCYGDMLFEV